MKNFIKELNKIILQFYEYLKTLKVSFIFLYCIIVGLVTGNILGLVSFIERVAAYGSHLSLINDLSYLAFSVSNIGLMGIFIGLLEFIILYILIYGFILLTGLTKKEGDYHPYKIIILLAIIFSASTTYVFNLIFIESKNEFFTRFLDFNVVFTAIFIIFFLIVLVIFSLLMISLMRREKNKETQQIDTAKKALIKKIFLVLLFAGALYYFFSLFINICNINSLVSNTFNIEKNSFWVSFLKFYESDTIFILNLFISLSVIYIFSNYFWFYFISKIYKYKHIYLIILLLSCPLFVYIYLLSQNIFTNQLFMKFAMTLIISGIAVMAFLICQIMCYSIYKYFLENKIKKKQMQTVIIFLVMLQILFLITGYAGFYTSNTLKAFVYRHCTYEKIVLNWPILFNIGKKLAIIPPKISAKSQLLQQPFTQNSLKQSPNIIIVVVDALRSDVAQESLLKPDSGLSGFSKNSYNFKQAYSHSTYTVASIPSLFTSKRFADRADLDYPSIAEFLSINNYVTYCINIFTKVYDFDYIIINKKKYNSLFTKGFLKTDKINYKSYKLNIDKEMTKKFIKFLNKKDKNKPVFAYIHYSGLHFINPRVIMNNLVSGSNFLKTYKKEFNKVDDNLKYLINELKKSGNYDNSIIIITSDHGEAAKEHGDLFHIYALYQEFVRVPLFIKLPNQNKRTIVDQPVSHLDVVPTILDYLKYDYLALKLDGKSLLPIMLNNENRKDSVKMAIYMFKDPHAYRYSLYGKENYYNKSVLEVGLVDQKNEWKLIHNTFYDFLELYNLKQDPEEKNNLIDVESQKAKELIKELKIGK